MALSDDDKALFRTTLGSVKPIKNDKVVHARRKVSVKVRRALPENQKTIDMMSDASHWLDLDPDVEMRYAKPGIQRRLLKILAQGRIEPEAGIDLHGLTVEEARDELSAFLYDSLRDNCYCVIVVHGQGYNSPEGPIIRGFVNKWLRLKNEVLAFSNAPQYMGGRGATLVLLRRGYEF